MVACGAYAQQTTQGQELSSGIDMANFDLSVKPGDDFYQYAAGAG